MGVNEKLLSFKCLIYIIALSILLCKGAPYNSYEFIFYYFNLEMLDLEKYDFVRKIRKLLESEINENILQIFNNYKFFLEENYGLIFEKYKYNNNNRNTVFNDYLMLELIKCSGRVYTSMEGTNLNDANMSKLWLSNKVNNHDHFLTFKNSSSIKVISIFQTNRFSHEYPHKVSISTSADNLTFNFIKEVNLTKGPEDLIILDKPIEDRFIKLVFPDIDRICITKIKYVTQESFDSYQVLLANIKTKIEVDMSNYILHNSKRYDDRYSAIEKERIFSKLRNYINRDNKFVSFRSVLRSLNDSDLALDNFRKHLRHKLSNYDNYGLHTNMVSLDIDPRYYIRKRSKGSLATDLIAGKYRGFDVEPGKGYDWEIRRDARYITYSWDLSNIHHLIEMYIRTSDIKYLLKWIDYLDDWSLNFSRSNNWNEVDDLEQESINDILTFYKYLGTLCNYFPSAFDAIPTITILRVVFKMVEINVPAYIYYMRNNSQNWRAPMAPIMIISSYLLDEFDISKFLLSEGIKAIEDYTTNVILPDGSCTQQCPWYNFMYYHLLSVLDVMKVRRRAFYWLPSEESNLLNIPLLEMKLQIFADKVGLFLKSHIQYNSQYPAGARTDNRNMLSSLYNDSGVTSGISTYSTSTLLENTEASSYFPQGGFFYIKDKNAYGFLFNSPKPGAGEGFRSNRNNNTVTISMDGSDLLVSNEIGNYDYVETPVTPIEDGKEFRQNMHTISPRDKDPAKAHKGYIINAWTDVADVKYYFDDDTHVIKSIYSGPYQNESNVSNNYTHTRILIYVKSIRSWIIKDSITHDSNSDVHAIQRFWLPSTNAPELDTDIISFNSNEYHLKQFNYRGISLVKYPVNNARYKIYDLLMLSTSFNNEIISVLSPKELVLHRDANIIRIGDYFIDLDAEVKYNTIPELPKLSVENELLIVDKEIIFDKEVFYGLNSDKPSKKISKIKLSDPGILRIKNTIDDHSELVINITKPQYIAPIKSYAYRNTLKISEGDWRDIYIQMANRNSYLPSKEYEINSLFDPNDLNNRISSNKPYLLNYRIHTNIEKAGTYYIDSPIEYCQMKILLKYELIIRINGQTWQPTINFTYPGRWYFNLATGFYQIEIVILNFEGNTKLPYYVCEIDKFIKS